MPDLVIEYTDWPGSVTIERIDENNTMLPKPCGTISHPADCSTLKVPRKFTCTTRSNSSPEYFRIGLRTLIAGVHTTPSRRLCVAAALTIASLTDVMSVMSITPAVGLAAGLRDHRRRGRGGVGVDVEAPDVRALLRGADGDGLPDARAGADHCDRLSFEAEEILHRGLGVLGS